MVVMESNGSKGGNSNGSNNSKELCYSIVGNSKVLQHG